MKLKRISDEEIDAVEQKLSEDPLEELHLNRGHIENYGDKIADAQLQADQSVVDELADELRVGGILLAKRTDQCRELELKLKEYEDIFDANYKADMRAVEMWRKDHPGNDLKMPDRTDMVVWLLGKLGELEAKHKEETH